MTHLCAHSPPGMPVRRRRHACCMQMPFVHSRHVSCAAGSTITQTVASDGISHATGDHCVSSDMSSDSQGVKPEKKIKEKQKNRDRSLPDGGGRGGVRVVDVASRSRRCRCFTVYSVTRHRALDLRCLILSMCHALDAGACGRCRADPELSGAGCLATSRGCPPAARLSCNHPSMVIISAYLFLRARRCVACGGVLCLQRTARGMPQRRQAAVGTRPLHRGLAAVCRGLSWFPQPLQVSVDRPVAAQSCCSERPPLRRCHAAAARICMHVDESICAVQLARCCHSCAVLHS